MTLFSVDEVMTLLAEMLTLFSVDKVMTMLSKMLTLFSVDKVMTMSKMLTLFSVDDHVDRNADFVFCGWQSCRSCGSRWWRRFAPTSSWSRTWTRWTSRSASSSRTGSPCRWVTSLLGGGGDVELYLMGMEGALRGEHVELDLWV